MTMRKNLAYFGRKTLIFIFSVFILSILIFYISRLAPGDPLYSYYGDRVEKMSVEEKQASMERLGLNDSYVTQYIRWLSNAIKGDFGISFKYKQDVTTVISSRAVNTLILGGLGFIILFALALLLGIICAYHEDSLADRIICKLGTIVSCIPEFWMALILIMIFSVSLKLLPSSGAYSIGHSDDLSDRIAHLILPLIVVVSEHLWYYAYMIRNKLISEKHSNYVLLARSKGLTERQIMTRHCLRVILPTYFSIMAISVPHVMGGTYIVETVFSYPGIGTLSYESARFHDYNLLMLLCLISGIIVIFCNMLSQIINEKIDPRIAFTSTLSETEVKQNA